MKAELLFQFAVMGLNITMGSDVFVPSLLVFGASTTFLKWRNHVPSRKGKMNDLRTAREEATNIRAEKKVNKVIKSHLTPAVKCKHKSRDSVYPCRETQKE